MNDKEKRPLVNARSEYQRISSCVMFSLCVAVTIVSLVVLLFAAVGLTHLPTLVVGARQPGRHAPTATACPTGPEETGESLPALARGRVEYDRV